MPRGKEPEIVSAAREVAKLEAQRARVAAKLEAVDAAIAEARQKLAAVSAAA